MSEKISGKWSEDKEWLQEYFQDHSGRECAPVALEDQKKTKGVMVDKADIVPVYLWAIDRGPTYKSIQTLWVKSGEDMILSFVPEHKEDPRDAEIARLTAQCKEYVHELNELYGRVEIAERSKAYWKADAERYASNADFWREIADTLQARLPLGSIAEPEQKPSPASLSFLSDPRDGRLGRKAGQ